MNEDTHEELQIAREVSTQCYCGRAAKVLVGDDILELIEGHFDVEFNGRPSIRTVHFSCGLEPVKTLLT